MRLSTNISYKEATHSNTATKLGIDNIPNEEQLKEMESLAVDVFQPLREYVDGPIRVTSFFRCSDLNRAVGGSTSSQHCKGQAIDLDDTFGCKTNAEMFEFIKENLKFDQLIWEFGDDKNPDWIHVSYVTHRGNRGKVLKAYREDGRTKYKQIDYKICE
tara:strand:+ start:452 stop:928 length:477 start_codon:yes stop_codon:yes gene_type:complete